MLLCKSACRGGEHRLLISLCAIFMILASHQLIVPEIYLMYLAVANFCALPYD